MIRPAIFMGVLAALPSMSHAQGIQFDGAATLGYNFNTISGIPGTDITLNGASLDFEGDLTFSEQFSLGLGFGFSSGDLEVGGTPLSANIDLLSLSVEPVYNFGNGGYVGAYYRMGDLDLALVGPITVGIDTSQYGIFGGYDFGQGHVEAFYGVSDIEPGALIPVGLGVDVIDYGISGSYEISPQLDVYAALLRTDIDGSGGFSLPVTTFSIGADYAINDEFMVYGAVGRTNIGLTDIGAPSDVLATGLTLGGSYDLSAAASMPLILSAEYSHTVIDGGALFGGIEPTVDRFALGLTIPIGNNGSSMPLNSNTRTARGDYRSALSSVINSF